MVLIVNYKIIRFIEEIKTIRIHKKNEKKFVVQKRKCP